MGNTSSLPGLSGGRTHVVRYNDPDGSMRGRRPEQIQVEAKETQLLESIEEESLNRDNEVEVLEPPVSHNMGKVVIKILQGSAVTQTVLRGLTKYLPVANFL